jgi:choline dehydrogenase-like flavoprotein
MPILDSSAFEGSDALPDCLRCDIGIVGTGPAGITIARELSNTPLRVIILESGRANRQEETDALNEIENVGRPRVMGQWLVRNRIVGGSSKTWGAVARHLMKLTCNSAIRCPILDGRSI